MAELSTLARPYAKAAFEYAREHNALAQWSEQLATAASVAADDSLQAILDNPSLTAATVKSKLYHGPFFMFGLVLTIVSLDEVFV